MNVVYSFGAKPPVLRGPEVLEQMRLANRYQNALVEIERARRAKRDAHIATLLPAALLARIAELEALIQEEKSNQRAARAKVRARVKMDTSGKARIVAWAAELKTLRQDLKSARAEVRNAEGGVLGEINEAAYAAVRDARSKCGVFWGTYLLVERAMDMARRSVTPPHFKRFDGSGQIAVQLQGKAEGSHRAGLPGDATLGDTRLQILTMSETEWRPSGPNPNLDRWRLLRIRIGSDGRSPVWAEVPFRMDRPLPPGSVITWASVQRRRCGSTFTWHVQFTLALLPTEGVVHANPSASCGIDIGWRVMPSGLRTAFLSDGTNAESLVLPPSITQRFEKADQIRSGRDKDFDRIRAELSSWMKAANLPDWLREACATLPHWRASAKLARVVLRWRNERFAGDEGAFEAVEGWRKQDRHLLEMESHIRQRAQNARLDLYRNWALRVCRRYARVVIEGRTGERKKMNLADMQRLPDVTSGKDPLPLAARNHMRWACDSSLRLCLEQAALKTGTVITLAPAANTTRTCHVCGNVEEVDVETLAVRCSACEKVADQDLRAAENLLREGEVRGEPLLALAM